MSKDQIRESEYGKNNFFTDKAIITSLVFLGVFLLVSWILWYVLYQQITFSVGMPAYFNFLQPHDFLYRYVLPLFVTVIGLFHMLLAYFAYNREKLVSYIIFGSAAFMALLVVITGIYYMSFV